MAVVVVEGLAAVAAGGAVAVPLPHAPVHEHRAYVAARGFLGRHATSRVACTLRSGGPLRALDWCELSAFLAAFPGLDAHALGAAAPGVALLDYKDAWRLLRLTPYDFRVARNEVASAPLPPTHAAFIMSADLTLDASVFVPLHVLRRWAGVDDVRAPTVTREHLVARVNRVRAATAALPPHVRAVVPRHARFLRALLPACRGMAAINAWVAPHGVQYRCVPFYVRPPRRAPPRFSAATPMDPQLLALAMHKFGWETLASVAEQMESVQAVMAAATFCFPCAALDVLAPDNDTDATTLTPWADLLHEQVVCWGTLGTARYLSLDDLQGWFDAADRLARFGEPDAPLADVEVHDLLRVLSVYRARLVLRAPLRLAADTACGGALARLIARVKALRAAAAHSGVSAELWDALAADAPHGRDLLVAALRALHAFAAYALHWRGPGTPLPRVGDAILHLEDTVDTEARIYEVALPPLIAALDALPPRLAAALRALPQYAAHGVPGSIPIGAALDALQAGTAVTHKLCIRLAAAPLWHAAVAHAANFCRVALPPYA